MTRLITSLSIFCLFLAGCGSSISSDPQNSKRHDIIYVSLMPSETGGQYLYLSSDIQFTSLKVKSISEARSTELSVEEVGTADGRRFFVTPDSYEGAAGSVLSLEAKSDFGSLVQNIRSEDLLAVPEFGKESSREIVTQVNELSNPRDLKFNPTKPNELWIVNQGYEGVVIVKNAGMANQTSEKRIDSYSRHFMSQVSSLSFGTNGFFASCQESRNEAAGSIDFMGPTLWTSDLSIFAKVNQTKFEGLMCGESTNLRGLLGSHMDMLHQSPLCMGIAHAQGNAYWVFDGKNGNIVLYDFVKDHGPGYDDHSDGELARYPEAKVKRVAGVPGHMVVDQQSGWLYIADTGSGRITRLDTKSGSVSGGKLSSNEPLAKYVAMKGATYQTFKEGLKQPSGLLIHEGKLFVSDHATGEIIAFDLKTGTELSRLKTDAQGIMGITIAPDGMLWFVDGKTNRALSIKPSRD